MNKRERAYLESFIENSALLGSDIAPLDDGEAYSSDYCSGSTKLTDRGYPLRWGRVIRSVSKSVDFEEVSDERVIAKLTRTIHGVLKISAPYQFSTRVRHSIVSKPFRENSIRRAVFRRIGISKDPSKNWRLQSVSIVTGGTEHSGVYIDEFSIRRISGEEFLLSSPHEDIQAWGDGYPRIPMMEGETDFDVKVRLNTGELEPNMVVLRSGFNGHGGQRTLLPLKFESKSGESFVHTYENTVRAQPRPGVFHAVVEAISRETLCDVDAPVSTSFWGVPYVIQ